MKVVSEDYAHFLKFIGAVYMVRIISWPLYFSESKYSRFVTGGGIRRGE